MPVKISGINLILSFHPRLLPCLCSPPILVRKKQSLLSFGMCVRAQDPVADEWWRLAPFVCVCFCMPHKHPSSFSFPLPFSVHDKQNMPSQMHAGISAVSWEFSYICLLALVLSSLHVLQTFWHLFLHDPQGLGCVSHKTWVRGQIKSIFRARQWPWA